MISRRSLLNGIGLAAALSSVHAAQPPAAAPRLPQEWAQTFDVIVVGGGGAGLAAAVAAAQKKASVCLIEKMPLLGGNTLRSTGYLSCVEPRRQTLNGIRDSEELHFSQTMQAGLNRANPQLVQTMVSETPKTVAWLEECGVLFQDSVYEIYGSGYKRCLKPVLPRGTAYIRALSQRAIELGVRIKLETSLTDIYLDAAGEAVGVAVRSRTGATEVIGARRGIVIATGGYGANAVLIEKYAPVLKGLPTDNSPGSTGDALFIARRLGIALEGLEYIECVAGNPPGRKTHARLFIPSDFILINEKGERFVEEDALRRDLTMAILAQPHRRCYTVFDSQGVAHLDPISQKGLYQALVADEAWSARTLEELAALMHVPAAAFTSAVGRYNDKAAAGAKTRSNYKGTDKCSRVGCTPLTESPYWAYEVGLTVHYTPGGIVINEKGQCLTTRGRAVGRLWAAGEATGSVHGANRLGGNGLADALTFGRLAGTAAAQNLP